MKPDCPRYADGGDAEGAEGAIRGACDAGGAMRGADCVGGAIRGADCAGGAMRGVDCIGGAVRGVTYDGTPCGWPGYAPLRPGGRIVLVGWRPSTS